MLLLLKFGDKAELNRRTALLPFALLNDLSYTPAASLKLFGRELNNLQYDELLLANYRVPLFPVIEADKLSFAGNKITFTNEGKGCLPPAVLRARTVNGEFELGAVGRVIAPNEIGQLFIEENVAFVDFMHSQDPNLDIKIVISFTKFRHSYDYAILAQSVGDWLEKVTSTTLEVALPYEVSLISLGSKEFERLCYWVVSEDPKNRFSNVTWLNENGGAERGRDVLATETVTGKKYVFQCKCVEKFDPNAVQRELSTFARYVSEDPSIKPDVYVFFLACSINDQVEARGNKLAQQIGMKIEYWSKGEIEKIARTNKRISDRFWRVVRQAQPKSTE